MKGSQQKFGTADGSGFHSRSEQGRGSVGQAASDPASERSLGNREERNYDGPYEEVGLDASKHGKEEGKKGEMVRSHVSPTVQREEKEKGGEGDCGW